MEYPFKDLLPLDEVLEREGYYKDWTHLDPEVFYSLTQISEYIKTKGYGADVRLLIAQLAEHFGLKTTQVVDLTNLLQQKFENLEGVTQSFTNNINSLVAQMEADKNAVIANATVDSEVILARGGKPTLGARLDDTTAQLTETTTKLDNLRVANVRDLGAKGDGVTDDTEAFENAFTLGYRNIYIPVGRYRITRTLEIPSIYATDNIRVYGAGNQSKLLNDVPSGDFMFYSAVDNPIGGFTFEDFDIRAFSQNGVVRDDTNGFYIGYATRVNKISNVRIHNLSVGIHIGNKVEGQTALTDIGMYWLRDNEIQSKGLIVEGNTVFGTNIEILGYKQCVTWSGSIGSIKGGNIGGSTGFFSEEAFIIDGAIDVEFSNIWVERLSNDKYGLNLARAIEVFSGEKISFRNMHLATGSIIVHEGEVHVEDTKLWGGGRTAIVAVEKNAKVLSTNNTANYYGKDGSLYMEGKIKIIKDFDAIYESSNVGLLDNPILTFEEPLPVSPTNTSLVSLESSNDFISGENSIRVINTGSQTSQGLIVNAELAYTSQKDLTYVFVARVKSLDGGKLYFRTDGNSNAQLSTVGINRRSDGSDDFQIITGVINPQDNSVYVNIVGSSDFIVDSVNVFPGFEGSNPSY